MVDSYRAVRRFERFLEPYVTRAKQNSSIVFDENWTHISTIIYNPSKQTVRVERVYDADVS